MTEISPDVLRTLPLPQYSDDSNKADCGKLLLVAGSRRLTGAAILAARAALRTGCGSVRLATPASVALAIGVQVPELMVLPLPETSDGTIALEASALLDEQYAACGAAVIGPGLDENEETRVILRRLAMEMSLPSVLDASALLAHSDAQHVSLHPRIITSSQQEFEALYGATPTATRETRMLKYVEQSQGDITLVLQGRQTLVASKPDMLYGNAADMRGLGSAGSGDVLAGIIGGLLAQFAAQKIENSATRAALWGVHLHALCGEAVEKDLGDDGMIASDLITRLPGVLRFLRKQTDPKHEAHFGLRPKL